MGTLDREERYAGIVLDLEAKVKGLEASHAKEVMRHAVTQFELQEFRKNTAALKTITESALSEAREETERYRQQARQIDDEFEECRQKVTQQVAITSTLAAALVNMLASAHPNPQNHPAMTAAWANARAALDSHEEAKR